MELSEGIQTLIGELDQAVRLGDVQQTTQSIKRHLSDVCVKRLELPERFLQPGATSYARRLLHRDNELGYTVVVMTWGAGQQTALHDHAGIWCVECVVAGSIEVQQFERTAHDGEVYEFEHRATMQTGIGDAGCLIPPYEYHVLSNAHNDSTSITVHVYGGEMDHCCCYEPLEGQRFTRRRVELGYDS